MEHINRIELRGVIKNSRFSRYENETKAWLYIEVCTTLVGATEDGSITRTDYFGCHYWLKEGETEDMFSEGKDIHLVGRLDQVVYTDYNGIERDTYEVIVNKVEREEE